MPGQVSELRQARRTALLVGSVLLALSGWSLWRNHPGRAAILAAAGGLILLGLAIPPWAVLFHRGWMKLAATLGYVNSRILLAVSYYGMVTPLAFFCRLAGRDPLDRRRPGRDSYWIPRPKTRQDPEQFERLF